MVVSTVLRPPWMKRTSLRLLGTGFYPLATTATPLPKSPHEFSMRLAAHLCRDRPHRHHRPWTKLVNLLTARSPRGSLLRSSSRLRCKHRVCTCHANSSSRFYRPISPFHVALRCGRRRKNSRFLATLIIWFVSRQWPCSYLDVFNVIEQQCFVYIIEFQK